MGFCRCVELRGQQKPEETSVCGWHQACRAVAHCATTCDCCATLLGATILGNMGEGCRPLPRIAAPQGTARQGDIVAPWRLARQLYPAALKLKMNQYAPPPRSKSTERRSNIKPPRHARRRGYVAQPRHAVWHDRGGHQVPFQVTSPCKLCRAMHDGATV
jgi:hypothetical protein